MQCTSIRNFFLNEGSEYTWKRIIVAFADYHLCTKGGLCLSIQKPLSIRWSSACKWAMFHFQLCSSPPTTTDFLLGRFPAFWNLKSTSASAFQTAVKADSCYTTLCRLWRLCIIDTPTGAEESMHWGSQVIKKKKLI